ncbi:kinase-like domain-containing protein [Pyronema omphalodes]|nr:kinase-like domain-containing protein [Pyronema omphalodes]
MAIHDRVRPALTVTTASPPEYSTPPRTPIGAVPSDWNLLSSSFSSRPAATSTEDQLTNIRRQALFAVPSAPDGNYTLSSTPLGVGAWASVVSGGLDNGVTKTLVAIKKPTTAASNEILLSEAKILSYITSLGTHTSLVSFHGYNPVTSEVVMSLVPGLTLRDYSRKCKAERKFPRAEPVMGLRTWLTIAEQLASAFSYLKTIGVVHGDVTWNNIIMREDGIGKEESNSDSKANKDDIIDTKNNGNSNDTNNQSLTPVIIDFSSSHLSIPGYRPPAISATTTNFVAPEVLEAHLRGPITPPLSPADATTKKSTTKDHQAEAWPIPTFASDLYGLGMTLLSAAIGDEVYGNLGRYKAIYVCQGAPLDWVRNGDMAAVVGVRGVVNKTLKGCFGSKAEGRMEVEGLGKLVDEMIQGLEKK